MKFLSVLPITIASASDNIDSIRDDFFETVKIIYSDEIPNSPKPGECRITVGPSFRNKLNSLSDLDFHIWSSNNKQDYLEEIFLLYQLLRTHDEFSPFNLSRFRGAAIILARQDISDFLNLVFIRLERLTSKSKL